VARADCRRRWFANPARGRRFRRGTVVGYGWRAIAADTLVPSTTFAAEKGVTPPLVETFAGPPFVSPVALESTSLAVSAPGVPL
jgi:hypothetical protein